MFGLKTVANCCAIARACVTGPPAITLLYNSCASRAHAKVACPRFFDSIRGKDDECQEISKSQSSTMTSHSE